MCHIQGKISIIKKPLFIYPIQNHFFCRFNFFWFFFQHLRWKTFYLMWFFISGGDGKCSVSSCFLDWFSRSHSSKYPHLLISGGLKIVLDKLLKFLFVTSISLRSLFGKYWLMERPWSIFIYSLLFFFLLVLFVGYPYKNVVHFPFCFRVII